jgi:uncharacterized protein
VSAGQPAHPGEVSPGVARTGARSLVPALRHVAAFAILLGGMLWIAGWLTSSSAVWFLWLGIGALAAAVAGSRRGVWLVALATLAVYPVAALALERARFEPVNWAMLVLVGGMVTGAGYALALVVLARVGPAERRREMGGRVLVVGALALGALGIGAWFGYTGKLGSDEILLANPEWAGCDNPMSRFGWDYEAVNYDLADDVRLMAENPDPQKTCASQGTEAGTDVVTSDGVPIAAFYIPVANGAGATAPTIVVAPGWKSNKSEILKYAPFFHERFNLVLVDLRNGGRSGGDTTTWGVREQLDIRAIVDWLEREKHPAWIGAMGNSMGAAVLTAAAAADDRIRALILDSMHASIVTTFGDGIAYERKVPGYPTAWAAVGLANLRSGEDLTAVDPQRTLARLGDRPVLLIHGTNDGLDTPQHSAEVNLAAAQAAGVPVTLEYCEGGTHGALVEKCPVEWQAWVDGFLADIPELAGAGATP